MKQLATWLLAVIFSWQYSSAQVAPAPPAFSINSAVLGEQCKAFVYLPADYETSTSKYPVIYVLDAEYNATFTAQAVKILTESERVPPAIIIGITTNNRTRDLTPAGDKNWKPPQEMPASGGAGKFLNYLEKELIPYVEKNYRTEPFRVIIGHSLGGLLALHSFTTRPGLFQATIALESSLWWNDGAVGNEMMSYLNAHPGHKGKLFIGRIKIPREAWFPINIKVVDFLEKSHPVGLDYTYMEIENETHATMVFPATYFGLRDIFSDYFLELNPKETEKTIMSYYATLSAKYGYTIKMPEQQFAFLWDIARHEKKYPEAIHFAKNRIANYPNSYRAYMDIASTYTEMDNKEMAIQSLTKALELNPGDESLKQKLNALKAK